MSRLSAETLPVRLQRCSVCGHPNQEHRGTVGCTVPRCECHDFADYELHPSKQTEPH